GETYSVRTFVEHAFAAAGHDIIWQGKGLDEIGVDRSTGKKMIAIDPNYFRPTEVDLLLGDPTKAREKLGWVAKTQFKDLVTEMIDADMKKMDRDLKYRNHGR
uniref:GDP-mannose 4,6-dehydratase n=1 Tax=Terasakiella pusilla TaxID=64973 RepID=UPI003AA7EB36